MKKLLSAVLLSFALSGTAVAKPPTPPVAKPCVVPSAPPEFTKEESGIVPLAPPRVVADPEGNQRLVIILDAKSLERFLSYVTRLKEWSDSIWAACAPAAKLPDVK